MEHINRALSSLVTASILLSVNQLSAVNWTGGGANDNWNNADNWDAPVPTITEDAIIDGAFTVDIQAPAAADRVQLGGSGSAVVDFNINSSLAYGDAFGQLLWGSAGDTVSVNVNSNGVIDGSGEGSNTASRLSGNATVTLNPGSLVTHIYRQEGDGSGAGPDIIFNGGKFVMYSSNAAAQTNSYRLNGGSFSGTSGTLSFFVAGNNDNLRIQAAAGTILDLDEVTIQLDIINGYTPMVGDSFDFFTLISGGPTSDIGDGSNIATTSADGLWEFTYDLSEYNPVSAPNKGLITLTSVTSIPEPGAFAALLGLLAIGLCWLRRKR